MIFYDLSGRCVEVKRDDFYTDADYFISILKMKYGVSLEKENMSIEELCKMI